MESDLEKLIREELEAAAVLLLIFGFVMFLVALTAAIALDGCL